MDIGMNKKAWRFLPLSLITIWYLILLFLMLGGNDYAPCTLDGVNFAYVSLAVNTLWLGGTILILLISAAILFYFKYQPEWEFHLWFIMLTPAGLLSLFLLRLFYCRDWQQVGDGLITLTTGGPSFFFFSSITAAIAGFLGMRWSKKRP